MFRNRIDSNIQQMPSEDIPSDIYQTVNQKQPEIQDGKLGQHSGQLTHHLSHYKPTAKLNQKQYSNQNLSSLSNQFPPHIKNKTMNDPPNNQQPERQQNDRTIKIRTKRCRPNEKSNGATLTPKTLALRQAVKDKLKRLTEKKKNHYYSQSQLIAIQQETLNWDDIPKYPKKFKSKKHNDDLAEALKLQASPQTKNSHDLMKLTMEQIGIRNIDESFQIHEIDEDLFIISDFVAKHSSNKSDGLKPKLDTESTQKMISQIVTDIAYSQNNIDSKRNGAMMNTNQSNKMLVLDQSEILPVSQQLQNLLKMQKIKSTESQHSKDENHSLVQQIIEVAHKCSSLETVLVFINKKEVEFTKFQYKQRFLVHLSRVLLMKIIELQANQPKKNKYLNPYRMLQSQYSEFWYYAAILYFLGIEKNQQSNCSSSIYDNLILFYKKGIMSKYQRFTTIEHYLRDIIGYLTQITYLLYEVRQPQILAHKLLNHQYLS